jgi:hypothetical protein
MDDLTNERFHEAVAKFESLVRMDPGNKEAKAQLALAQAQKTSVERAAAYPTLAISVPADTKWEPKQAEELITTLMAFKVAITLRIAATNTGIAWQIEFPKESQETVSRAILSFYPQANIVPSTGDSPEDGATTWLRGKYEFFEPLLSPKELKTLDPLTGVVGAMANLEPGEEVLYQVDILPPDKEYQEEGKRKIRHGSGQVLFATLAAMGGNPMAARDLRDMKRQGYGKY